jgi:protein-S-isoprenylcysteine O-methyltransferase Ste14
LTIEYKIKGDNMKKIIFIPPVYFGFCILLLVLLFFLFPEFNLIQFPANLVGILVTLAGIVLILLSGKIFRDKKTTLVFDKPKALAKTGPYKFSRNPIYLGMLLILFGFSFCLGSLVYLISPLIFFLIINFMFIPFEEERLEKVFGKEYIKYKRDVRRWI